MRTQGRFLRSVFLKIASLAREVRKNHNSGWHHQPLQQEDACGRGSFHVVEDVDIQRAIGIVVTRQHQRSLKRLHIQVVPLIQV